MLILTLAGKGSSVLFEVYTGEDTFYQVIPYLALVSTMSALGIFAVAALLKGLVNMWREIGGTLGETIGGMALLIETGGFSISRNARIGTRHPRRR